jgi:hypothetical protein
MITRAAFGCVGALLLAGLGCNFHLGNAVQVDVKVDEQVLNDAVETVAGRLEKEMRRLGLQVVVSRDAEVVRLKSKTKSGDEFVVVLNRVHGPRGEQTRIAFNWERAPDRELWIQLLLVAGQTALVGT